MDELVIRFVPKNRTSVPRLGFDGPPPLQSMESVRPDKRRATTAFRQLSEFGLSPQQSSRNRLESVMARDAFTELFNVDLAERPTKSDAGVGTVTQETYLAPQAEIAVPEALKDTVDFAYVPRPR